MIIGNIKRNNKLNTDNREPTVLASIGASTFKDSIEVEIKKAQLAKKYGADIVIDHTLTPLHEELQQRIIEEVDLPLSSIAVYDMSSMVKYTDKKYYTEEDVLYGIEEKAKLGLDLMTIHASVLKDDINYFYNTNRVIPCTSRGGTMVLENIQKTGKENFYYTYFEDICKIAKKYNLTLSLGAVFRPADIVDAVYHNEKYWEEINRNAELVQIAKRYGVNIMVEGIGHCPISVIAETVKKSKAVLKAPYRVLTVATDCGLGYDHVSSSIAVATAVQAGADFVTAVSRSEHIGLPSENDLKEAIISARIAVHCGYISKTGDFKKDIEMSTARSKFGCRGTVEASIVPNMTREELIKRKFENDKKCTMCGDFCALSSGDRIKNDK